MVTRPFGYYWVTWSSWADQETVAGRPGPLLGQWDGKVWWFPRLDRYFFETEVTLLSERIPFPVAALAQPHAMAS
jgi:hypothetical protein